MYTTDEEVMPNIIKSVYNKIKWALSTEIRQQHNEEVSAPIGQYTDNPQYPPNDK